MAGNSHWNPSTTISEDDGKSSQISSAGTDNSKAEEVWEDDPFRGISIVPKQSKNDEGEHIYVLVFNQEGKKFEDRKKGVFDFDEKEEAKFNDHSSNRTTKKAKSSRKKKRPVPKVLRCTYCDYTCSKAQLLSKHIMSHCDERSHECGICLKRFKTTGCLRNHVNIHSTIKPYKCKHCTRDFSTSGEVIRHTRYRHTHDKPHKCPHCDYASVESAKLKKHITICATYFCKEPISCSHCDYTTTDMREMKSHKSTHSSIRLYQCGICQAEFKHASGLTLHRKRLHSKVGRHFECDLCQLTCGRKTELRKHIQMFHKSDAPIRWEVDGLHFQCDMCQLTFDKKAELRKHIKRLHMPDESESKVRGERFPNKHSYKVRCRTHRGEKQFKCDLCPFSCDLHSQLKCHKKIHVDNLFTSDLYKKNCRRKNHLTLHLNSHQKTSSSKNTGKTLLCHFCLKVFSYEKNLVKHLSVHSSK